MEPNGIDPIVVLPIESDSPLPEPMPWEEPTRSPGRLESPDLATGIQTPQDGLHLRPSVKLDSRFAWPEPTSEEAWRRHATWAARRQETWDALQRVKPAAASTVRFAYCGSQLWVQHNGTPGRGGVDATKARTICNCCRHRLCVACCRSAGWIVKENIRKALQGKTHRFLTFTLRHNRTPLADQIDRLYRCFNVVRRRSEIAASIIGGVIVLEIKVSGKDGLWHPHLHVLAEGTWIDQKVLSKHWYAVTGDSFKVDIRAIEDEDRGALYVSKYVTKPVDDSVYAHPEMLDEYIEALDRRKTLATFGSWRGKRVTVPAKDDGTPETWKTIGGVNLRDKPKDDTAWVTMGPIASVRAQWEQGLFGPMRIKKLLQGLPAEDRDGQPLEEVSDADESLIPPEIPPPRIEDVQQWLPGMHSVQTPN